MKRILSTIPFLFILKFFMLFLGRRYQTATNLITTVIKTATQNELLKPEDLESSASNVIPPQSSNGSLNINGKWLNFNYLYQ